MFQKRHYEAIAGAVRRAHIELDCDLAYTDAIRCVANHLACVFRENNPRFDEARFLDACEVKGD
jgi:hypothetical protein